MKITLENLPVGEEEEIIIRSNSLDSELMELIYSLKTGRSRLNAFTDDGIVKLDIRDVYYFESVDNKVFACCKDNVYEIKQKLYELEKQYEHTDFIRISKSMIADTSKICKIEPMFNGRLEAVLENGERIVISRQYVPALKRKLGV
ncbi:MAG: LytTR family DNA-binding domain-containing protein [Oscillospiraceae bacterium]